MVCVVMYMRLFIHDSSRRNKRCSHKKDCTLRLILWAGMLMEWKAVMLISNTGMQPFFRLFYKKLIERWVDNGWPGSCQIIHDS